MNLKTIASALAISVVLPTANAGTTYGCWSDASPRFRADCLVASDALLSRMLGLTSRDWANVPNWVMSESYGNCKASIKSSAGSSVGAEYILSSFNQLISRCQNGYFYYDNGWLNAMVQGHAGWKRDEPGNTTDASDPYPNPDFPHGGVTQWEVDISPEAFSFPQGSLSVNGTTKTEQNEKKEARDLTARDNPVGAYLRAGYLGNLLFRLYRSTQVSPVDAPPINYKVWETFRLPLDAMILSAVTRTDTATINTGFSVDAFGDSTITAVALATQLSGHYVSWQAMFHNLGYGSDLMIKDFISTALLNLQDNHWAGGIYHIYNSANDVIVTFILNAVHGDYSALPSN